MLLSHIGQHIVSCYLFKYYLCGLWNITPTGSVARASEVMLNVVLEDIRLAFTARLGILLGAQLVQTGYVAVESLLCARLQMLVHQGTLHQSYKLCFIIIFICFRSI